MKGRLSPAVIRRGSSSLPMGSKRKYLTRGLQHWGGAHLRKKKARTGVGAGLSARSISLGDRSALVVNGHAGDIRPLQGLAYRFGLIAVEAGKAGPEQLAVALGRDRLGERLGFAEQAVGTVACRVDALLGFAFALERTDLDDPAGVHDRRLARNVLRDG